MARPNKSGLDYFPFDVDFFEDEKIEAIFVEFGIKGEITVVKLLCAIYRNGYFILWNDRLRIKLLKNLPGVSSELLEQIIKRLVKWEFFNESLFNSASVLTSTGIQKRFFSVTKRRKQNDGFPYLLINVCNNSINVCNNDKNVDSNATKESKVKEEEYIPPIIPQGGMRDSDDNMIQIEKELKSREAKLLAKEQELLKREAALKTQSANKLPDISFVSDDFKEVFSSWLEYKRERKESYKSNKSLEACYKKILELSNNNPDAARLIVEQSMASNWSGIFELRNGNTGKTTFSPTATNPAGKVVRSEAKATTDRQSTGTAQKDYTARF